MATGTSTSKTKRGLCLLSLGKQRQMETCYHHSIADTRKDGGGIRGLSELIIIEELMERLKWSEKLDTVPNPADYFDLYVHFGINRSFW